MPSLDRQPPLGRLHQGPVLPQPPPPAPGPASTGSLCAPEAPAESLPRSGGGGRQRWAGRPKVRGGVPGGGRALPLPLLPTISRVPFSLPYSFVQMKVFGKPEKKIWLLFLKLESIIFGGAVSNMPNSARSQVCRLQTQHGWTGRGRSGPAGGTGLTAGLHTPSPAHQPCSKALHTSPAHPAQSCTPSSAHPPCTRSAHQPCTPTPVLHTQLCTPTLHTSSVQPTQSCTPALPTQPCTLSPVHQTLNTRSAHQTSSLLCTPDISSRRWYPKRRPRGHPTALLLQLAILPGRPPTLEGHGLSQASPLTSPHADAPAWEVSREGTWGSGPLLPIRCQQGSAPTKGQHRDQRWHGRKVQGAHWAGPGPSPSSAERPAAARPP